MSTNPRAANKKGKPEAKAEPPKAAKAPAKNGGAKAAAPAPAPKASKPAASAPRASKSKPKPRGAGVQRPLPAAGMSLDRKLDIAGIVLFFAGLGLLVSLFTAQTSGLLGALVDGITFLAGWGRPGLPLAIIGLGVWLVLRKFGDRLPRVEPERLLGLLLAYLALLTTLHFWAAETDAALFEVVGQGRGGGVIGALLLRALLGAFGQWGAAALLTAWWLIAVVFTAGLSVPELIQLALRAFDRLRGDRTPRQLPLPTGAPTNSTAAPAPKAPTIPAAPPKPGAKLPTPAAPPAPATGTTSTPPNLHTSTPVVVGAPPSTPPVPLKDWSLPTVASMLEPGSEGGADDALDRARANMIEATLASFGAPVKVVEVNRGPTITQFGVEPGYIEARNGTRTRVKVGKIAALADDLALALSAHSIRIEAPVPGKGFVGIEVPNAETAVVALRDIMESDNFGRLKNRLRLGLGQDVSGTAIAASLDRMPHLLIAGTTGSGKSVCVNAIIACLLLQNTPDELRFVMVDPKRVELTSYNGIPHLLAPVVVDLERVVASLQWVTREMDERYRKFAKGGVRNIEDYNRRQESAGEKKLPYLVIIIDELADLMMLAPDETERTITRLAQLARATGIHLIIATQRPSVDVVTGLIKANFPARIAFAVASGVDSRVILDQPGAERLLGRGDMLFMSPDAAAPLRMQGVYVSDTEIHNIVRYWKDLSAEVLPPAPAEASPTEGLAGSQATSTDGSALSTPPAATATPISNLQSPGASVTAAPSLPPAPGNPRGRSPAPSTETQPALWDSGPFAPADTSADGEDELLEEAIKAVREMKKASISLLQRRLRIGYTRSARLIDVLEEKGIIGPAESGAKPREVINYGPAGPGADPPAEAEDAEPSE